MQAKPALGEAATTINGETVHHLTDQHWRRISSLGEPRLPGSCRLLPGHQIEIFDILPVKFDGKAFESNDFHECLTLPLPFDRDVATVHRLLFEGILAGNFTSFRKPRIDRHRVISSRNASKSSRRSEIPSGHSKADRIMPK